MTDTTTLAPGWEFAQDPATGRVFYQNVHTKETRWDHPGFATIAADPADPAPDPETTEGAEREFRAAMLHRHHCVLHFESARKRLIEYFREQDHPDPELALREALTDFAAENGGEPVLPGGRGLRHLASQAEACIRRLATQGEDPLLSPAAKDLSGVLTAEIQPIFQTMAVPSQRATSFHSGGPPLPPAPMPTIPKGLTLAAAQNRLLQAVRDQAEADVQSGEPPKFKPMTTEALQARLIEMTTEHYKIPPQHTAAQAAEAQAAMDMLQKMDTGPFPSTIPTSKSALNPPPDAPS